MGLLYGRGGRLTTKTGDFRPGQYGCHIPSFGHAWAYQLALKEDGGYSTVRTRLGWSSSVGVLHRRFQAMRFCMGAYGV